MEPSKQERFAEFLRRLERSPCVGSHAQAFALVCDTLNAVENELTDIPYNPDQWQTDGRIYPPQSDSAREVSGRADIVRYRHKGHNTFIRENGAIQIEDINGRVLFQKPGADGRGSEL